jgi:hypothetical protein
LSREKATCSLPLQACLMSKTYLVEIPPAESKPFLICSPVLHRFSLWKEFLRKYLWYLPSCPIKGLVLWSAIEQIPSTLISWASHDLYGQWPNLIASYQALTCRLLEIMSRSKMWKGQPVQYRNRKSPVKMVYEVSSQMWLGIGKTQYRSLSLRQLEFKFQKLLQFLSCSVSASKIYPSGWVHLLVIYERYLRIDKNPKDLGFSKERKNLGHKSLGVWLVHLNVLEWPFSPWGYA